MDSSVGDAKQFNSIKSFIKRVVGGFSFNATGPKAALVSFSDQAVVQIPFEFYSNPLDFKKFVDLIPMEGGKRRISIGLEETFQELVKDKAMKPHVVFLITTGQQNWDSASKQPSYVAEFFHELGIKIMALGVGDGVDKMELEKITKDSNSVKIVEKHEDLANESIWKDLTMKICYSAGRATFIFSFDNCTQNVRLVLLSFKLLKILSMQKILIELVKVKSPNSTIDLYLVIQPWSYLNDRVCIYQ